MNRDFRRRRVSPLLAAVVVLAGALLSAPPVAVAVPNGGVYMRDNDPTAGPGWPTDNGFEPNPWSDVWNSPDIQVVTPLIVGGTSTINVVLRNDSRSSFSGNLQLYYTAQGTAAQWPGDWNPIATVPDISVSPFSTRVVPVKWVGVPGPGHFCLLARWASSGDTMTFAEGPDTYTNVRKNNNLAWKNADSFVLKIRQLYWWPVRLRNPEPDPRWFDLVLVQPARPFVGPGKLVVDLGPTLGARWLQAGQPGIGVRPAGGNQVEIVDPQRATIQHLLINPDDRPTVGLGFTADTGNRGNKYPVNVIQTDDQGNQVGGLQLTATVE